MMVAHQRAERKTKTPYTKCNRMKNSLLPHFEIQLPPVIVPCTAYTPIRQYERCTWWAFFFYNQSSNTSNGKIHTCAHSRATYDCKQYPCAYIYTDGIFSTISIMWNSSIFTRISPIWLLNNMLYHCRVGLRCGSVICHGFCICIYNMAGESHYFNIESVSRLRSQYVIFCCCYCASTVYCNEYWQPMLSPTIFAL